MKALKVAQQKSKSQCVLDLEQAKQALENEIEDFNAEKSRLYQKVADALEKYNEALNEAREFTTDIHSEMEEYYENRSDRWKEGDAGSNYQTWMDEWANIDLDEISLEEVADLEMPDMEHYSELDNLPDEVES